MGVLHTWQSRSCHLSLQKDSSASLKAMGNHLNCSVRFQRAISDSALRCSYHTFGEDRAGDMSLKSLQLIDMNHSRHNDQKSSHYDSFPTDSDHKELKREVRRVAQLRDKLYGRRLQLKEKRNELRQERGLLVEIDSRFIKSVRYVREYSKEIFEDSSYNELDAQRDVVGLLQYEYDQAEDEHDVYESQLEQEEKKLVKLLSRLIRRGSTEEVSEESTSESSLNSPIFSRAPEHPDTTDVPSARLTEYQSRVGDARIIQEQLHDMLYERGRKLSFSKKREKFGLGREASDVSTENFEFRYADVAKELNIINDDVQHLKEALEEDGYLFPEVWLGEEQESGPASQSRTPSVLVQRQKKRSDSEGIIPILGQTMAVLQDRINRGQKIAILQDRIHRWIFMNLRDSPVEHVRHKVILREICPLDDETWAHVVPEFWTSEDVASDDEINSSILRLGALKAEEAWKTFKRDFPFTEATKDRARPYHKKLADDIFLNTSVEVTDPHDSFMLHQFSSYSSI